MFIEWLVVKFMLYNIKAEKYDERLGFAFFLAIFVLLYGVMNYFVLSEYTHLFGFDKNYIFYFVLVVLTLSYGIAAGLNISTNNHWFKAIYLTASTWMGVLFLSFSAILIYLIINKIVPLNATIAGIIIVCFVMLATIYSMINAERLSVKELNVYNDKKANLRIVQISDLHIGPINGEKYLKRVVDKVNSLKPDVVLITGDLIDGRYKYKKELFNTLNELHAKTYFINGNHEVYAGLEYSRELLKGTGIQWLDDEVVDFKGINIIGIGDTARKHALKEKLYALHMNASLDGKYNLLMTHRPRGWEDASKYVDMMVCGHTHAGQIWPFIYLSWLEGHASRGVYRMKGNEHFMLYVNSGTGTWGPPMRLGSHTEITVFNLKARNA